MDYLIIGFAVALAFVLGWVSHRLWMHATVTQIHTARADVARTVEFVQGRLAYFESLERLGGGLMRSIDKRGLVGQGDKIVKRFAKAIGYRFDGDRAVIERIAGGADQSAADADAATVEAAEAVALFRSNRAAHAKRNTTRANEKRTTHQGG